MAAAAQAVSDGLRRSSFIQVLDEMDGRHALLAAIALHAVLVVGFMIPAFILARIQAGGFNVVFTAILLLFYTATLFLVLPSKQPDSQPISPLLFGAVLGATSVMAFISLMTAVFWGQFSGCQEEYSGYVDTYTCYSPKAMTAVAAFASLLFVVETVLGLFLVAWVPALCPDYQTGSSAAGTFAYESIPHQGYAGREEEEREDEEGRIVILDRAAVLAAAVVALASSSASPQSPGAPALYQAAPAAAAAESPATTQPQAHSPTRITTSNNSSSSSSRGGKNKRSSKKGTTSGSSSGGNSGKR